LLILALYVHFFRTLPQPVVTLDTVHPPLEPPVFLLLLVGFVVLVVGFVVGFGLATGILRSG
jgi:hypothetical protein